MGLHEMLERIKQNSLSAIGILLMKLGTYGSVQMCAGFFHEMKVPKELEEELEKELK